eukprot:Phypoly_transcript_25508.p1 GENE.Phypoly_transcript_25508~~Phypoly_transcript_25508.p1  ORF type:complete len:108 (+),score=18.40 Phypoly_transcript_25508:117-440(+)
MSSEGKHEFRDYKGRPLQQEPLPPTDFNKKLGFMDSAMGIDDAHMKDNTGKVLTQAKKFDRYYSSFVRVSGYSWAIAIMAGGLAFGAWKLFGSRGPKETHHTQPVAK